MNTDRRVSVPDMFILLEKRTLLPQLPQFLGSTEVLTHDPEHDVRSKGQLDDDGCGGPQLSLTSISRLPYWVVGFATTQEVITKDY